MKAPRTLPFPDAVALVGDDTLRRAGTSKLGHATAYSNWKTRGVPWYILGPMLMARLRRLEPRVKRVGLRTAALVCLLALFGCGLPTMTRADMRTFDRDHYECYREASTSGTVGVPLGGLIVTTPTAPKPNRELYGLCMKARGYQRD